MHKIPPSVNGVGSSLPTAPTEEQLPIRNINSTFPNAIIPKKKSIPRGMKIKQLNFQLKEARTHLKSFPRTKANQLNHCVIPTLEEFDYDYAIIYVGINNIL